MTASAQQLLTADAILESPEIADAFRDLDFTTRMLGGHWISQCIYVAAQLNLADFIDSGVNTNDTLAAATETHAPSLFRLLRVLVSVGLLGREGKKYTLTPWSERLLTSTDHSEHLAAIKAGEHHSAAWGDLLHSIKTGESGFEHVFGMPIFDYLDQNPQAGKMFDSAMSGFHGKEISAVVESYDFSPYETIVDMGGGNGSFLCAILKAFEDLHGILFELPGVAGRAVQTINASAAANRCEIVEGSFATSDLPAADAYMFRHVIHNWEDEKVAAIFENCRRTMSPRARLLLIESVLPENDEPFFGKILDLAMLTIPGGRERTESEYRKLFGSIGFELKQVVTTSTESSVIEFVQA